MDFSGEGVAQQLMVFSRNIPGIESSYYSHTV